MLGLAAEEGRRLLSGAGAATLNGAVDAPLDDAATDDGGSATRPGTDHYEWDLNGDGKPDVTVTFCRRPSRPP